MTDKINVGNVNPTTEAHAHSSSHEGTYVVVFLLLAILTLIELVVTYIPTIKIVLLLVLSATKAILVASFYMHLRYERPFYPLAFAVPVVIAVLVALAMQQLVLR